MAKQDKDLQQLINQQKSLEDKLLTLTDHVEISEISKKIKADSLIVNLAKEKFALEKNVLDLEEIINDSSESKEMSDLASLELTEKKEKLEVVKTKINQLFTNPPKKEDTKDVIMEIRAGTGGDEAALFANDLFCMYKKYSELNNWTFSVLSSSHTDLGGLREANIEISGGKVYGDLKYESGVHRVQRIPKTETSGRLHTSAVAVIVLAKVDDMELQIDEKDLRVDRFRAQGAGGQHVNKTESAIRITHLPTGIVAQCQDTKSQHRNRERAMVVLKSRMFEQQIIKRDADEAVMRKSLVKTADRSERIRTYNFPQNRLTDHRINFTLRKLDSIISGDNFSEVILALKNFHSNS